MCSQFGITTDGEILKKSLSIPVNVHDFSIDKRVRGFLKTDKAPVILFENGKYIVKEKHWSLCPSWARDFPFKPHTYNARLDRPKRIRNKNKSEFVFDSKGNHIIESILDTPSFKDSFSKGQTCLVPITYAVESCYFGSQAGNIIQIKLEDSKVYFVLGLYNDWLNKETGEIAETFTLLTDHPYRRVFDWGHDRSIITISDDSHAEWLSGSFKGTERLSFIREQRIPLDWIQELDRPLVSGWNKPKNVPSESDLKEIESHIID